MKAVICTQYGPPEVLHLTQLPKPVPKADEVLIKIHATTVTVADFRIRSFTIPKGFWLPARLSLGIFRPRNPVLGVELAGVVEATGKEVSKLKVGDAVFAEALNGMGAYAEYKCLPEKVVAPKPANLSFGEAATLSIGARTALHYLRKIKDIKDKKLLIYGASGSVGTYAVQLAKLFGAEVTGVCSTANLNLVKSLGADRVLDYTIGDFTNQLDTYDVILVAVDKWPFKECIRFVKDDGIYMNVTAPLKSFAMLGEAFKSKKKIIIGENVPVSVEDFNYLKELAEAGQLKPVIDRTYTLDEIVEAHRYVDKGHKKGNVVINVVG
ncbi:NAD(P)-dependent alcohol dehydrogenase [Emticicia agri]|uniref:NAD(P)-dependent alcohol dehydrogenase n=1 Tax=Emticicia agri TaxID=2492393 RepID=A0A4Q5LUN6_9BACT|nr:NAD(P)-dependent alcohol dehydrogenase [Emticicia agri]RYU93207.1 NAD(P)-dependent alcohol dehydrogenase [Emticicia agri]